MRAIITPLFSNAKVKLTQTPRAVTPFGGLASFVAFLNQWGLAQEVQTHMPWQLTSPNAIALPHTLVAFIGSSLFSVEWELGGKLHREAVKDVSRG